VIALLKKLHAQMHSRGWHRISNSKFKNIGLLFGIISVCAYRDLRISSKQSIVWANAADESEVWDEEEERSLKGKRSLSNISVFSGNGNPKLAKSVCEKLGIPLGKAIVSKFADGETNIRIEDSVRGKDVYVIQPTCPPINDNLMELILMISTLRRASAGKVTAVIPYYGYARQDRKREARETIGAADIARLLESTGVDHVLSVDLHRGQMEGFFDTSVPVDNFDPRGTVVVPYLFEKDLYRPVVVAPSETGIGRALSFRKDLLYAGIDAGIAFLAPKDDSGSLTTDDVAHHHRVLQTTQVNLVGEVMGCDVIIIDDMIDTGSRMALAAATAKNMGANRVFGVATHGLLSGQNTLKRLQESPFEEIILCDTIPKPSDLDQYDKFKYVSVSDLIAKSISNLHKKRSLSVFTGNQG
jgi:ribose-phosphate pyrophosphokinase